MAITSKKINPSQLDKELGGQGLIWDFNDPKNKLIKAVETSTVTEKELEDAIKAHVANPTEQEIKILNRQQGIAKLKELGLTDDQISALLS